MINIILHSFLGFIVFPFRSKLLLQAEILALRHQLLVYQRSIKRCSHIKPSDRVLWAWLSRIWTGWLDWLVFVKPEKVIKWRRKKFREHWAELIRRGKLGRPKIVKKIRRLIRDMSIANPLWGSARIIGELSKIDIDIAKSTVEKYMEKHRKPPSQTWRTFLTNHVKELVSIDFFVVPTVRYKILFVLIVLRHDRRTEIYDS